MPRAHTASQAADRELARLLQGYSIEVTTHSRSAVEACRAHLAPGTEVYIAFVPGETHHAVAATAARLRAAGSCPCRTSRRAASRASRSLTTSSARLAGEAGVTARWWSPATSSSRRGRIIPASNCCRPGCSSGTASATSASPATRRRTADRCRGARAGAARQARAGARRGPGRLARDPVLFRVSPDTAAPRAAARFGIASLARRARRPGRPPHLVEIRAHCGIGNSIRALGTRVDAVANLLARRTPDAILRELAAAQRQDPGLGIEGIHIFTFGGVASAASWPTRSSPPRRRRRCSAGGCPSCASRACRARALLANGRLESAVCERRNRQSRAQALVGLRLRHAVTSPDARQSEATGRSLASATPSLKSP